MPPEHSEQAKWFAEHLQVHEAMLRAWLRSRFSSACDIDDIVQEAYLRALRAHEEGALQSPKAYLLPSHGILPSTSCGGNTPSMDLL